MAQLQLNWITLTKLNTINLQNLSENIQGVYRLSYKHKDGNIYVFYVGSSENIKSTLLDFLNRSDNRCIELHIKGYDCYFRYAKVENTD